MKFTERDFVPVLFGGDINSYSVARAFYEQYGVKSYVFGKYANGPSYKSKIIEYTNDVNVEKDETFIGYVNKMADKFADKKIVLVGCGDSYVALASRNKDKFRENVIAPYIPYALMEELQLKERFYSLAWQNGIDYPHTFVYKPEMGHDFQIEYEYPVILKPSNGVMYWEHEFPTQKKVYKIKSREELDKVIDDIYGAGYTDSLIIQDTIPGNDEYMYVLTSYSGKDGKVKMMCLGHVLLEEHTPHGMGNHAVILTEKNEELMMKVKGLLEDLNYVGYSNFDIKYDTRDGKFKFFEINTRQGRSNYYVTGSGFNVAKYIVEDYVYNKELGFEMSKDSHLWLVVPKKVAFKYVKNPENLKGLKENYKNKSVVNPVFMKGDINPERWLRMMKNHLSHYKKFETYYK
ncbi:MAG: ATP-grasp domain-containing protein [Lachnospiraceae bacterium]|nr:ATP-grasp domain-containing protein [Lachnospiraceae bacterium]